MLSPLGAIPSGTRAVLNGHDENGPDITWEEGDVIEFKVEVSIGKSRTEGKLVYENGVWVTYEAQGASFSKVDRIAVRASTLDCSVRTRFSCMNGDVRNGDPNAFNAVWVQTVPFAEGLQTVLVTLPFGD